MFSLYKKKFIHLMIETQVPPQKISRYFYKLRKKK